MNESVQIAPGVDMPLLGLGTWKARGRGAYDAVRRALELGYRLIDTATVYGNEQQVGKAVADSGIGREEIFVTTKLPPRRAGSERQTLEKSLADLGLDRVDLWLVHWPPSGRARPETWARFLELRDAGLARAVGVSNYGVAQIDELARATSQMPSVNQIEWSPALYDERIVEEHRRRGVQVEGYSPLRTVDLRDERLAAIADAHGVSPTQVVIRWHLEHRIVVIPKSTNPEHITSNADVFGFSLSPDEVAELDGLGSRRRR
jgi:2,5-diketo-D-gluconate reductase A